ncbi:MAG TPA: DUF2809 domain-containing protein [bacterium]|nr:DUF2809 domain-containing protein [bacterium]HPN44572.1 DUF2809 domain-containing protein [bacterium]
MKQKLRLYLLFILLVLIPAGIYTKFYHGPGQIWVYNYAGDILYAMFWYFLLLFAEPLLPPLKTALVTLLFCSMMEFSQLFTSPLLEKIRSTFLGRTLIGVNFNTADIFYYFVGCGLACIIYKQMLHLFGLPSAPPEPERHNDTL